MIYIHVYMYICIYSLFVEHTHNKRQHKQEQNKTKSYIIYKWQHSAGALWYPRFSPGVPPPEWQCLVCFMRSL